jgi:hypothetical protein
MDDPEFQRGEIDIQWLERRLTSLLERRPSADQERIAAIAAALLAERDRTARSVSKSQASGPTNAPALHVGVNGWKQAARTDGLRD